MTSKTIKTRAKINLTLDVLYKREDGYHELETIFQSIDLYDVLEFKPYKKDIIIKCNHPGLPTDAGNIVYAAANLLKKEYNIDKGIEITIDKNIPVGSGLGGGSSNGAGTLKMLNILWDLNLPMERLMELGKRLGADIPFCLLGGTALARGIGERLEPLPPFPTKWLVLVKPNFSVSTSWAYQNINFQKGARDSNIQNIIQELDRWDIRKAIPYLRNKFEEVVIPAYPEINKIKEKMVDLGGELALMSGSGPVVFGICKDKKGARQIYNYFKEKYGEVFMVKTYNE